MRISNGLRAAAGNTVPYSGDVAISTSSGSYLYVYPWTENVGFGAKYADPSVAISGNNGLLSAVFTSGALIASDFSSGILFAYKFTKGSGFGTRYSNPASPPGSGVRYAGRSPNCDVVFFTTESTPYVHVYKWDDVNGFGTKYASPSPSVGPGTIQNMGGIDISHSSSDIVIGSATSPYIYAYTWTYASGFGTKYANPSTLPLTYPKAPKFSKDDNVVLFGGGDSTNNYLQAYNFTPGSGFGSKFANPSLAIGPGGSSVESLVVHPKVNDVIISVNSSSGALALQAWSFTPGSGFGSRYALPGTAVDGTTFSVVGTAITPNGNSFAVTTFNVGSRVNIYTYTGGVGFGTKYSGPATISSQTAYAVSFLPT